MRKEALGPGPQNPPGRCRPLPPGGAPQQRFTVAETTVWGAGGEGGEEWEVKGDKEMDTARPKWGHPTVSELDLGLSGERNLVMGHTYIYNVEGVTLSS